MCKVFSVVPSYTGQNSRQLQYRFNKDIRKQVRDRTRSAHYQKHLAPVKSLQVQGNMLTLAAAEQQDVLWKSQMFHLKSGTLKFMINGSIDTFPTPANLKRWKYNSSEKCKLCGNRGTTNHCINCGKLMLNTYRYT